MLLLILPTHYPSQRTYTFASCQRTAQACRHPSAKSRPSHRPRKEHIPMFKNLYFHFASLWNINNTRASLELYTGEGGIPTTAGCLRWSACGCHGRCFTLTEARPLPAGTSPRQGAMDGECPRACAGPGLGASAPGAAEGCDQPGEAMRAPGNSPRTGGAGGIPWVLKLTRVSKPLEDEPRSETKIPLRFLWGFCARTGPGALPERAGWLRGAHGLPSGSSQSSHHPR